jgi:hypothetical protein
MAIARADNCTCPGGFQTAEHFKAHTRSDCPFFGESAVSVIATPTASPAKDGEGELRDVAARAILDGWFEGNQPWDTASEMTRFRAYMAADAAIAAWNQRTPSLLDKAEAALREIAEMTDVETDFDGFQARRIARTTLAEIERERGK